MKKIVGLMIACLLLLSSICFAKVVTVKDDFDGSSNIQAQYVRSNNNFFNPHEDYIVFAKGSHYVLSIGESTHGVQGTITYDQNAEIKIDGVIYNGLTFVLLDRGGDVDNGWVHGYYGITDDLIDRIRKANQISVRTSWHNGGSSNQITVEIPKYVQNEWRQVINSN